MRDFGALSFKVRGFDHADVEVELLFRALHGGWLA